MLLKEAIPIIKSLCSIKFEELFLEVPSDIKLNKGKSGQLLETLIGLRNGNQLLDFVDGELKTNKSNEKGEPKETMFITQISSDFDDMFAADTPFEDTRLFSKIKNMVYVPGCKVSNTGDGKEKKLDNPNDWFYVDAFTVDLEKNIELCDMLKQDFIDIRMELSNQITLRDGFIHTANGGNRMIQVRSKDSKPYHPIYSEKYGRFISNKNHAFYFRPAFMNYVRLHAGGAS